MATKRRATMIAIVGILTVGLVPAIGGTSAYFTDQQMRNASSTADTLLAPAAITAKAAGSTVGTQTAVTWANAATTQDWATKHGIASTDANYSVKRSTTTDFSNSLPFYTGADTSTTDTSTFPVMRQTQPLGGSFVSTCALSTAGTAYCWGQGDDGMIGDANSLNRLTPTAVVTSGVLKDKKLIAISGSWRTMCALDDAGAAYCWGNGPQGQLGNNSTTLKSNVPVAVSGSLKFKALSVGTEFTCGSTLEGLLYCWGTGYGNTPVAVGATEASPLFNKNIVYLSGGDNRYCVIDSEGQGYCWITGGTISRLDAISPLSSLYKKQLTQISMNAGSYLCALDSAGTVYCTTSFDNLVAIALPAAATTVSASNGAACAVTTAGLAYCWGTNGSGQNGIGNTDANPSPKAVLVAAGTGASGAMNGKTVTSIFVSSNHTCAIDSLGASYCWGASSQGRLGNGSDGSVISTPVATTVQSRSLKFTDVVTANHTCALESGGTVYCWGGGANGRLGMGLEDSTVDADGVRTFNGHGSPTQIKTSGALKGKTIVSIDNHNTTTCALDSDKYLYCWGSDTQGLLGPDAKEDAAEATLVDKGTMAGKKVNLYQAGAGLICIVDTTNAVSCWGDDAQGQVGDDSEGRALDDPLRFAGKRTVPTAVVGLPTNEKIVDLALSRGDVACVLTDAGSVWCWGANSKGTFPDGTTGNTTPGKPKRMNLTGDLFGKTVTSIEVGSSLGCAIAGTPSGGTVTQKAVYCWGDNTDGNVGVGSTATGHINPTKIAGAAASIISPSSLTMDQAACVVDDADGSAYCWGSNTNGQQGQGDKTARTSSVKVKLGDMLAGTVVTQVATGNGTVCLITSLGPLYCIGANNNANYLPTLIDVSTFTIAPITAQPKYGCANGSVLKTATTCTLSTIATYYYQVSYKYLLWESPAAFVTRTP
jgi:alpha-tubulin suppressor-like RCC1 family protein